MHNSGKLLIIAMLLVGLAAAGASWWFRYAATHRAAQFWGPDAVRLIRDAPHVQLLTLKQADGTPAIRASEDSQSASEIVIGRHVWTIATQHDISAAPGLTHLRNALLEDRSFNWGAMASTRDEQWTTALQFRDSGEEKPLSILFVADFQRALKFGPGDEQPRMISTRPIAAGLSETMNEWAQDPAPKR